MFVQRKGRVLSRQIPLGVAPVATTAQLGLGSPPLGRTSPPRIELREGSLLVNGIALLEGVPATVFESLPHSSDGGVVLGVNFALGSSTTSAGIASALAGSAASAAWRSGREKLRRPLARALSKSQHDLVLGHLKAENILACARIKRWWMAPSWPSKVRLSLSPSPSLFLI